MLSEQLVGANPSVGQHCWTSDTEWVSSLSPMTRRSAALTCWHSGTGCYIAFSSSSWMRNFFFLSFFLPSFPYVRFILLLREWRRVTTLRGSLCLPASCILTLGGQHCTPRPARPENVSLLLSAVSFLVHVLWIGRALIADNQLEREEWYKEKKKNTSKTSPIPIWSYSTKLDFNKVIEQMTLRNHESTLAW